MVFLRKCDFASRCESGPRAPGYPYLSSRRPAVNSSSYDCSMLFLAYSISCVRSIVIFHALRRILLVASYTISFDAKFYVSTRPCATTSRKNSLRISNGWEVCCDVSWSCPFHSHGQQTNFIITTIFLNDLGFIMPKKPFRMRVRVSLAMELVKDASWQNENGKIQAVVV